MRRVLVLGGGQVGTFSARAISEDGGSVVTADVEPVPEYFARFGPQVDGTLVRADICNFVALSALLRRSAADVIVLSAGVTRANSARDARTAWRINVHGARTVARAALDHGVKRLVFVSSFAVYGRPAVDSMPESLPLSTRSVYGRTKVAAETALVSLRTRGLDVRVLRPCGLYGPVRPGSGSRSARLIALLLLYAMNREPLTIEAEGELPDEYLYIKDLARAVAQAALCDGHSEHFIFNVGPGRITTIDDLCAAVRAVIPTACFTIRSRPGRVRSCAPLDVSRVRATLGFEPQYSLVQGLSDYVHGEGLVDCINSG